MGSVTAANYADFGIHLAVDLLALLILGYGLYFRRHRRRDLLTCIVCFNVSLFVVLAVIDVRSTSLGVGFGLFALLSIISLRSDPFSTVELGYFFSGLVVGVVNGLEVGGGVLDPRNELFALLLTATVVLVVWLIDHPRLQQASGHQQITLDQVHADPAELRSDLEARLGVAVTTATVLHTDYVQQTMLVDVRYDTRRATGVIVSQALDVIDDRLATIGLTELNARAALQTRVDSKYLIGLDVLDALVERLRTDRELATDVLEVGGVCEQTYDTVYFDRPGLGCYADHLQRRRLSYKLRTRVYLGSELHVFEVKMRDGRGHTVKVKTDHRGERPDVIGPAAARFYRESIADRYGLDVDAEFAPSLRNRYTRITLAARHGQERTTIDHTLTFLDPTPTSPGPVKWPESVEERTRGGMNADLVLVETKSAHGAGRVDRALWSLGARPSKVSKYCIGIGIVHGLTDPTRRWPNRYLAAMRLGFSLELPVEVPTGRPGAAAPPISVEDLPKAPRPSRATRPPRPVRPPR